MFRVPEEEWEEPAPALPGVWPPLPAPAAHAAVAASLFG